MVAGVIGAEDNDFGVVGIAPGARIWAVRVGDEKKEGQLAWLLCGLRWVADHADIIEVANLSLGSKEAIPNLDDLNCGRTNQDTIQQEICRIVERGVTVVAAAGNEQRDAGLVFPAAYDEVITVSSMNDYDGSPGGNSGPKVPERLATCWQDVGNEIFDIVLSRDDKDDTFSHFSNFGQDVDIVAPGACIRTTARGGGYGNGTGTSVAAPHVAGAAALYKYRYPCANPAEVQRGLLAAADHSWNVANPNDDPDQKKEPLLDLRRIVTAQPPDADTRVLQRAEIPVLKPGETANVTMVLQNVSRLTWTTDGRFTLMNVNNQPLSSPSPLPVHREVSAGNILTVPLRLTAPETAGIYESIWQIACGGQPYGERITVPIIVIPRDADPNLGILIQTTLDNARQALNDRFNEAWEEVKAHITQYLIEEFWRQVYRATGGLCGIPPAALVLAGFVLWRRRHRNSL